MDLSTIAPLIAARFGPTIITAPAGENAIRDATASLPLGLGPLPASYIFPPSSGSVTPGAGSRLTVLEIPVLFVRSTGNADPRDLVALGLWLNVLREALIGATQLAGVVAFAWIASFEVGDSTYAGQPCNGIRFIVKVTVTEAIAPVA